jgi:N-acetylmuramic acid 6-phosphate etherase
MDYKQLSKDFLENEKQFHLGVIPTEQSNPLTREMSAAFAKSTADGIRMILTADENISKVAMTAYESAEFKQLVKGIRRAVDEKRTVLLSSVGASGRLALQLNATWRNFWRKLAGKIPLRGEEFWAIANTTDAFTTGGDRAVVRSVENFEDYMTFGAQQIIDAGVGKGDVVIALAECGLSASINGSAIEADIQGCDTYYLYCNPKEILGGHLERCRLVFERENIKFMPLYVGQAAVSGSTRMQVTSIELLVAGAALELAAWDWLKDNLTEDELALAGKVLTHAQYAAEFDKLNALLGSGAALEGLAKAVDYETDTYENNGLITYVTHAYIQDILTDTTERQPTFTLPPFRRADEPEAPVSWAYAKDPTVPSGIAWQHILQRPVVGLDWTKEDYIRMGAAQGIVDNPPKIGSDQLSYYRIGWEDDPSRYERRPARLVCVDINGSAYGTVLNWYEKYLPKFDGGMVLRMGDIPAGTLADNEIHIPVPVPHTLMELMEHMLVKLAFNLLSTAAMVKMGRVWGNWMVQVLPTNKKLIDRSTRIIAALAGIPYEQASEEFFKSYAARPPEEEYRESYVIETLRRLGIDKEKLAISEIQS